MKLLNLNYLFLAGLFFLNSCSSNVSVSESKFIFDKKDNSSYRGCTKEDLTGIWELHTQLSKKTEKMW